MKKPFQFLFILYLAFSCTKNSYPESCICDTPSQDSLKILAAIEDLALGFMLSTKTEEVYKGIRRTLNNKPYNGWTYTLDTKIVHSNVYYQYLEGVIIRKIDYYSNGILDHDFSNEDGKSIGCERMWRENGDPYVEAYYSAPGIKGGYQRTWHADNKLALEAFWSYGDLIYQIEYDIDGNITSQKGNKPE